MSNRHEHHGIVVGVDGSPESRVAVDWAARDAVLHRTPVTLAYVHPGADAGMWLDLPVTQNYRRFAEQHSREIMRDARKVAEAAIGDADGISIIELAIEGDAVSSLVELSKHAQLVVVGSRGLGKVGRVLLGSVSSALVRHAHCPVAVIHDEDPLMPQPDQAPVVVGIDGSPASELATEIAFNEAARRAVELVAVHTWSDPTIYAFPSEEWTRFRPQAEQVLAERLAGWQERHPDVAVRRVVAHDHPARQLLTWADSAQLTVVGSHGRGGFSGMLLGSVSSAVVQAARMPVIVARQS